MESSTRKTTQEEMYGQERLAGLLCASRDLSAQEIADAILADVSRFQGEQDRFDDETIIVLNVVSAASSPRDLNHIAMSRYGPADQFIHR